MRLTDVSVVRNGERTRLMGTVEQERPRQRIECYFEYRVPGGEFFDVAADAFAPAMLLPAMRAGEPLEIVPPISPRLAFNLPRIRDIFHTWWPEFARIDIHVSARPGDPGHRPQSAATFFSGGLDSFYTLLKYRKGDARLPTPLSHVIFMYGIESPLELKEHSRPTELLARKVAAATGVECIVGETNMRTTLQRSEENMRWEGHYGGSGLAAVALGLSHRMAYVCIGSAFTYNHLVPHSTTPLVDEMYSTENLYVLHDGADKDRPSKLESILKWDQDLVLNHLRVCASNAGGVHNCGRCAKCVRMAIPLYILGLWDQARTFPDKSIDHWERVAGADHLALIDENLKFARKHGGDSKIIAILKGARRQRRLRNKALDLLETSLTPFHPVLLPIAQRVQPSSVRVRDLVEKMKRRSSPQA